MQACGKTVLGATIDVAGDETLNTTYKNGVNSIYIEIWKDDCIMGN